MSELITVTDATFQSEVLESPTPVLVDLWAVWCGPCKMIEPVLEEIAVEYGEWLKVARLNVDENPQTAMTYGVMSIPTLLLFINGELVERLVGYMPKERLLNRVLPHLSQVQEQSE